MREPTQTIWRTVVVAGAMLGTPACKAKPAPTTPAPASNTAPTPDPTANAKPDPAKTTDPGDPCNAPDSPTRTRGADDDGGGGVGRGFILS